MGIVCMGIGVSGNAKRNSQISRIHGLSFAVHGPTAAKTYNNNNNSLIYIAPYAELRRRWTTVNTRLPLNAFKRSGFPTLIQRTISRNLLYLATQLNGVEYDAIPS